jgi:hypothetical protein
VGTTDKVPLHPSRTFRNVGHDGHRFVHHGIAALHLLARSPRIIYNDNGTKITVRVKELRQGIENLNSTRLAAEFIDHEIIWKISPPSAPNFCGIWERPIGSSKRAMRAVLESRSVSDEVLLTVFAEVASLLNSRPWANVQTDPSEPKPLSSFHFIHETPHPHRAPDNEEAFDGLTWWK